MNDRTEDFSGPVTGGEGVHSDSPDRREEEYQWLLSRVSKTQLLDELRRQRSRVADLEEVLGDLIRTKELLADCEAKYRFIEQNTLDTMMAFDTSFRLVYCSPSIEPLTGLTAEEIVQRRVEKIVAPASLKAFMGRFAEQLSAGRKRENAHGGSIELEITAKEGSTVPVSGRLRIVWEGDAPSRILLVVQDMRSQRLMEKALQEETQRYRAFFQKAQEPMCIVTPQGTVVEVNDAWTELLGYPPQEVQGFNMKSIMPEIVLAYAGPAEASSSDWETWLKKRDGSIVTCLLTAITWASSDQTLLGHLFIVRNRTKRLE
jgi:PAS domain S-box-containing protein